MIDFIIDPEKLGEITVGQARNHENLIKDLNYLIEEGFIEIEEGEDGAIRLFSST